ncbi:unnamed protein product [Larinioides sclopetarius]|uniref:LIM and SH3 domain protein Lasp n=1 Tax=Larinioides sclopetarius TaxID=280406 RepID=A0AAV1ZUX5_9ARAC
MSAKRCSRCEKTVYPLEELKCLDKLWHKQCFKCQECGMTLNMKTYKGYNKQPYCNAHCPQAKHTAVADTPEIRRLAENTKLQSNVKYHEDFEKAKGKFTQVADDPETLRIRNTSKIISNVSYHGELERKKQMEQKRHLVLDKNGVAVPVNGGGEISRSPEPNEYIPPQQAQEPVPSIPKATGHTFKAMYDYVAQDSDEVSFLDGDLIINCNPIDDGWMTGTVQRTGQTGMLPANYVERVN